LFWSLAQLLSEMVKWEWVEWEVVKRELALHKAEAVLHKEAVPHKEAVLHRVAVLHKVAITHKTVNNQQLHLTKFILIYFSIVTYSLVAIIKTIS
jgi:hypothetical protein